MKFTIFQSKEWIHTLSMNGEVKDIAFSKDGQRMYSHGGRSLSTPSDLVDDMLNYRYAKISLTDAHKY